MSLIAHSLNEAISIYILFQYHNTGVYCTADTKLFKLCKTDLERSFYHLSWA